MSVERLRNPSWCDEVWIDVQQTEESVKISVERLKIHHCSMMKRV